VGGQAISFCRTALHKSQPWHTITMLSAASAPLQVSPSMERSREGAAPLIHCRTSTAQRRFGGHRGSRRCPGRWLDSPSSRCLPRSQDRICRHRLAEHHSKLAGALADLLAECEAAEAQPAAFANTSHLIGTKPAASINVHASAPARERVTLPAWPRPAIQVRRLPQLRGPTGMASILAPG
jgi:hypothetical protein